MASATNARWLRRLLKSNVLAMGCWQVGGRITASNDALLKLIGYSRAEVSSGKVTLHDLNPPEYANLDAQALLEARAKGECTPFEKEIIRKDGRRVPVLVGAATFGAGASEEGAFFAVDLSERKLDDKNIRPQPLAPELLALTDRQRAICLLLSYGEPEKRIANLLDLGLRTVELDKQRVAKQLGIPTAQVTVWSVENRCDIVASLHDKKILPDSVIRTINRSCQ